MNRAYDVVVLGATPAGLAAYETVLALGGTALLIDERGPRIPLESFFIDGLGAISQFFRRKKTLEGHGIAGSSDVIFDSQAFLETMRKESSAFCHEAEKRGIVRAKATVFQGTHLRVGQRRVRARRLIFAPISLHTSPKVPPSWSDRVTTVEQVAAGKEISVSPVFLGATATSLTIASYLHSLGVPTLVAQRTARVAGLQSPRLANYVLALTQKLQPLWLGERYRFVSANGHYRLSLRGVSHPVDAVVPTKRYLAPCGFFPGQPLAFLGWDSETKLLPDHDCFIAALAPDAVPCLEDLREAGRVAGQNALLDHGERLLRQTRCVATLSEPGFCSVGTLPEDTSDLMARHFQSTASAGSPVKWEGCLWTRGEKVVACEVAGFGATALRSTLMTLVNFGGSVGELPEINALPGALREGLRRSLPRKPWASAVDEHPLTKNLSFPTH